MKKKIIAKLIQKYIRTFPPISNGDNKTRKEIIVLINLIGGKKTSTLVKEVAAEMSGNL